jgi:hypothetical protein
MKDEPCHATGTEKLPSSVYFKNQSFQICRGSPSEIVLQMVPAAPNLTVRRALGHLVKQLALRWNLHVELPWDAPDEILSNLLLQVMFDHGIIGPTPLS